MNTRTLHELFYFAGFLLKSAPSRRKLRKLAETDPKESFRLSHSQITGAVNRMFDISGSTLTVKGLENIPEETCLFASNHLSYFDIVVLEKCLPEEKKAGFIAKDSLKKIPGLSGWMELIRCIFLNRTDAKAGLKSILLGADYLKDGYNMFIFPEGTRCKEGQLGEFKAASLKMAQKARVPVVPVAITGTSSILENNPGFTMKPSRVTITFGKPIRIHELPRPEQKGAVEDVRRTIQDAINEELAKN
ncbi:MAG: 1-acyl-sn-glycerol-3-phosphate acyltransferase [Eubacterium sp.]|nr:1-acyl-sn-glycerol-3-phosphate acyltransferase [Eubacterium sp.]